jgi:DNA-binding transcriptional MerR regulator
MNLIPEKKAAAKCGVCVKTLERWDEKEIGFPPIIRINDRKFRDADLLDAFLQACARASAMERPKPRVKKLKQEFASHSAPEAG